MVPISTRLWIRRGLPAGLACAGAAAWGSGIPTAHAAGPGVGLGLSLDSGWGSGLWDLGRALLDFETSVSSCLSQLEVGVLGLHPHDAAVDGMACSSVAGIGYALLALVAVVVIALGRMRLKTEQKRLDYAQKLVEQGMEPPPGLLMGPARNDLRKGIVLLFAGAGLFVSGLFLGDRGLAAGGLVPEFVGIGYLVSFWLASREPDGGKR